MLLSRVATFCLETVRHMCRWHVILLLFRIQCTFYAYYLLFCRSVRTLQNCYRLRRTFRLNCGYLTQNSMIHSIITTMDIFFILIFANNIWGQNNWLKFLLKNEMRYTWNWRQVSRKSTKDYSIKAEISGKHLDWEFLILNHMVSDNN